MVVATGWMGGGSGGRCPWNGVVAVSSGGSCGSKCTCDKVAVVAGVFEAGWWWQMLALHTKQSFQSNKTLRKLCGVLVTYQGLFFQKTSKKEFKSDLGWHDRSCVLFARISRSGPRWTGHKFSLRPNTHFHCLLEQRISRLLANVIYSVNLFNQEKYISIG